MPLDDATHVWSYAANCVLYEDDPGPVDLNVGTELEPKMVPRRQAWRDLYSRLTLEYLDVDPERIEVTLAECRRGLAARSTTDEPDAVWECAVELCEQALQMLHEAGARHDVQARQRLLASLDHANTTDILGGIDPAVTSASAQRLMERLDDIEKQHP